MRETEGWGGCVDEHMSESLNVIHKGLNFYRFMQILHPGALLPFYTESGSLLPNPHPMRVGHTVERG